MLILNQDELHSILGKLDQAIHSHQQWSEAVLRTLVCRLPYDSRDVQEAAHKRCTFGRWYYHEADTGLYQHPAFVAVEQEHATLHAVGAQLLRDVSDGKPIAHADYDRFSGSLQRWRLQITTLQRELQDSMYNLDPLTGATSRIGMLTRLREEHELVKRNALYCSVGVMDVDHLKSLNEGYGRSSGDEVLKVVVRYVLEHVRIYDMMFRYDGDEFLLCLPQTNVDMACQLAQRLRAGIEELVVEGTDGARLRVTASFGVTLLDPDNLVEESIKRAAEALHSAKAKGCNRVEQWIPQAHAESASGS